MSSSTPLASSSASASPSPSSSSSSLHAPFPHLSYVWDRDSSAAARLTHLRQWVNQLHQHTNRNNNTSQHPSTTKEEKEETNGLDHRITSDDTGASPPSNSSHASSSSHPTLSSFLYNHHRIVFLLDCSPSLFATLQPSSGRILSQILGVSLKRVIQYLYKTADKVRQI